MIPVYRYKGSLLQRSHPATQIILVAALVALALLNDNPFYQLSIITATALLALAAGVFTEWLSWWKLCLFIGLAALIINPLVSRAGTTVLWRGPKIPVLGRLDITIEAIAFGAGMALRLAAVIWAFALISLIMDPDRALGLLKGRGSRSALLSALSLRMVPTAMRDASDILDAHRARGIARDSGGRWEILKSRLPLLKRLVTASLDRAISLAEAMEARAYGTGRRSRFNTYRFSPGDLILDSLIIVILGLSVSGLALGLSSFSYYPTLSWKASPGGFVLMCLPVSCALFILLMSELSVRWNWLRLRI